MGIMSRVTGGRKIGFFLMLAVLGGTCAGLFLLIFEDAKKDSLARMYERQSIHARQAASGISDHFRNWTNALVFLSRTRGIIDDTGDGRAAMDLVKERFGEEVHSLTRMNAEGVITYTTPYRDAIGSDLSGQEHIREILASRKPVVSKVFRTVQGTESVAIHVPVFRGDEFRGTLGVALDFALVVRRYVEQIGVGESGYAFVLSREGTILYSPVKGYTGRSISDLFRDNPSALAMAREMQQGREGTAAYEFDRVGTRKTAPFRKHGVYMPIRLGNTYWSVAVVSAEEEAMSSLVPLRNRLIAVMGAVLLGGIVLAAAGAKAWLIVREEEKRRAAEEDLKESEARYRELFERNPAPMLIYAKDTLDLLAANEAFLRHYGYDAGEAASLRLTDLYPEEERGAIAALATRLSGHAHVGEWHHIRKDGTRIAIVASSHDIKWLGREARIGVITDVTERKRAEDRLRELDEKLERKDDGGRTGGESGRA